MILWVLLAALAVFAAAASALPLLRRQAARASEHDMSLAVLKDQLAEIDDQVEAGAITSAEAEALRNEIRRRLLAEARTATAPARPMTARGHRLVAGGVAAFVALGAAGLYALLGRPDLTTRPAEAPAAPSGLADLIRRVEARLAQDPADPEGWRILGLLHFQAGRFAEAASAYRRAATLAPDQAAIQSAFGEALVQAAQGNVTPEAAAAFDTAIRLDPADARARYFQGALKAQRGDRQGALNDWIALLGEAPADANWAPQLREAIERLAREEGIDLAGRLPPPVAGPSADQLAAAGQMTAADRDAMIRGMVDGLAARLQASPRDVEGWIRLMRARMVLGERAAAADALRQGLAAFDGSAAEQDRLRAAARLLGVPTG